MDTPTWFGAAVAVAFGIYALFLHGKLKAALGRNAWFLPAGFSVLMLIAAFAGPRETLVIGLLFSVFGAAMAVRDWRTHGGERQGEE